MSHSTKKSASGCGNIRKRIVKSDGKEYTYWEARYTAGFDPGTGKQIQKSISGKTQKEVAKKLKEVAASIDAGTYVAPSKMTISQWMDIWQTEYLVNTKHSTKISYMAIIRNHIKPNLGAVPLTSIMPHQIQSFYNRLSLPTDEKEPTSPKTIKNIHGVLHRALQQAVLNGMISTNPCNACVLPKVTRKEIKPLDEDQIADFLRAISGHRYEELFITTIFSGMREGEVCGLQWDCINLERGTVLINKQLQKIRQTGGEYRLLPTKNSKGRSITLAPFVVTILRQIKKEQLANRLRYGESYDDSGFVFADELGHHLSPQIVYRDFKKIVADIGCPHTRFHDLRHTYAVVAIQSGDDIKTVQENLGHATAAFTLDVYGHVTDKMKQESANRMERFIRGVTA